MLLEYKKGSTEHGKHVDAASKIHAVVKFHFPEAIPHNHPGYMACRYSNTISGYRLTKKIFHFHHEVIIIFY